jgi:hypothetical protein
LHRPKLKGIVTRMQIVAKAVEKIPLLLLGILYAACILAGCQTPEPGPAVASSADMTIRNNCYSLLHDVLADEKKVGLLRFIKREEEDVKGLVKRIAAASGTGAKLLEDFAKRDPSIKLDQLRLPPGEAATRQAIASTKQKELLSQSGGEFEKSLLLTQAEALSYASHLAMVGAQNESQPERARSLTDLSEELKHLHREVVLLLTKASSAASDPPQKPSLGERIKGIFK